MKDCDQKKKGGGNETVREGEKVKEKPNGKGMAVKSRKGTWTAYVAKR